MSGCIWPIGNPGSPTVKEMLDVDIPARKFSDYQVTINRDNLPQGVRLEEKI